MKTVKPLLLAWALTLALLGPAAAGARAGGYALVTIENQTRAKVHYQLKWGKDGEWESFTLKPDYTRNHYVELDKKGLAPTPYVRFDDGDGETETYALDFYTSYDPSSESGKLYLFRWRKGYLDLYEK
jgi:hypothetical protein